MENPPPPKATIWREVAAIRGTMAAPGNADQGHRGQTRLAPRSYLPCQTGSRFSANALEPSIASSEPNTGPVSSPCLVQKSCSDQSYCSLRTFLEAVSASGAFFEICAASSRAASTAPPGSATTSTSPSRSPSSAVTGSPVSTSFIAAPWPTRRGSRSRAPPAATSERLTSGTPSFASRAATMRSQASALSSPPATAKPSTAAISGLRDARWTMPAKPRSPPHGRSPVTNALRSIPAQKKPPAPVRTPTLRPSSASSSSSPAAIPSASGRLTALRASGRLSVMTRTLSRRSVRTAGCSVLMGGTLVPEAFAQVGRRRRWVPVLAVDPDDLLAAVLFQPRVPGFVVAFLPGAAVGLVGVELDDEVVVGPVAVDGEMADGVVENGVGEAVEAAEPAQEVALPLAPRMRQPQRRPQRSGARLAAPVAREGA